MDKPDLEENLVVKPEPILHGYTQIDLRVDDSTAEGVPAEGLTREEVLECVPEDLRTAVLEEGLVVDVAYFQPALFPVALLVRDGAVATPAEVLDTDGVLDLSVSTYRPCGGGEFFSLEGRIQLQRWQWCPGWAAKSDGLWLLYHEGL